MTRTEVQNYLRISYPFLRKLIRENKLKATKPDGLRWFIDKKDLEKFLKDNQD